MGIAKRTGLFWRKRKNISFLQRVDKGVEGDHGGGEKKEVLEFVLGVLTKKRLSLLGNETKNAFSQV